MCHRYNGISIISLCFKRFLELEQFNFYLRLMLSISKRWVDSIVLFIELCFLYSLWSGFHGFTRRLSIISPLSWGSLVERKRLKTEKECSPIGSSVLGFRLNLQVAGGIFALIFWVTLWGKVLHNIFSFHQGCEGENWELFQELGA